MNFLGLLGLLIVVMAQHHHNDPFAGSGCDCDRFCRYECAINATSAPIKTTVYRMTMQGVYDLHDKNTGDTAGDTSFVISKKNNAFQCRQNPNDFMCKDLAQFSGDDVNSTDLILEMLIEADGQWGPYLECNPMNASEPRGLWSCETDLPHPAIPGYPKECTAAHYRGNTGYCIRGTPAQTLQGSQADCCTAITKAGKGVYGAYEYYPSNSTCNLYSSFNYGSTFKCSDDNILGYYEAPQTDVCQCERVYKAVGRQNQSSHGGSYNIAGGLWFSHPAGGECLGDARIGDSSGCTYKPLSIARAINATCMYKAIDAFVEAVNPSCFSQCPQPSNVTSTCDLECFSKTTKSMSKADLVKPWASAFATDSSGCPQVHIPLEEQAKYLRYRPY